MSILAIVGLVIVGAILGGVLVVWLLNRTFSDSVGGWFGW